MRQFQAGVRVRHFPRPRINLCLHLDCLLAKLLGQAALLDALSPESLKIFRFLLDFWESWRLSRVRNGVGI
jgi:hypothetical protein